MIKKNDDENGITSFLKTNNFLKFSFLYSLPTISPNFHYPVHITKERKKNNLK
jgi:hypothetical protein